MACRACHKMRTLLVLALVNAVVAVVVRPHHTTAYPSGNGTYIVVGWTRRPDASLQCRCFGTGDTDGRPDEAHVCTCTHAPAGAEQLQTLVSGVSVCVPPLYGSVDMRAIDAWVSWYEGAGAGTIFMYTMSDTVEVLSPKVARVHMVSVPWMVHKNVWQRGQLWSVYDCLHRVRAGGGKWALFIDIDEYLVAPVALGELTLQHELRGAHAVTFGKRDYPKALCVHLPPAVDAGVPIHCDLGRSMEDTCPDWQGVRKYAVDVTTASRLHIHRPEVHPPSVVVAANASTIYLMHCHGAGVHHV